MSTQILLYLLGGTGVLFAVVVIAYMIIAKKMRQSEYAQIKRLMRGTKQKKYSKDITYQKLYLLYFKTPFIKRYIMKIRRRLEILNIDDEYITRRDSARVLSKVFLFIIPVMILTIIWTNSNALLMGIILLFEIFMIDTFIDMLVDKMDNNLLKEQLDFFAEIRHAYHEFNMVEEAIYQVSLDDEKNISRQGEKIYEVLISDDPETELEKYYDVAPNSYLKEFAGISYLTKEFGDRDDNGTSLYLKNINNITQEMQIEILKRDKLNYVFQSLAIISVIPVLMIEPLKRWAVSSFTFTSSFYNGKAGLIVQILLMVLTFICYVLTRKLKDNGSTVMNTQTDNPWQEKLYKKKYIRKFVNLFIPKKGTKEYRNIQQLQKDSASKIKMEWLYVNRIVLTIVTFIVSIFMLGQIHNVAIDYVYTQPTTDYNLLGDMSEKDKKTAMELTEQDNYFLDMFRGKVDTTQEEIEIAMRESKFYDESESQDIEKDAKRVLEKLKTVNSEVLQWFELLLGCVFAVLAYMAPVWIMIFQRKMRQMDMEDEVMQFQTIILMLMKIERVNVEMILEWLERYSNIFKEKISKCVNNYEAGAWEALEELKNEVSYEPMIRIAESLQASVEKIPIREAFDELDSDRDYHNEKRKESNNRLISRKAMIGKVVGFAPMIALFVGYLIIPLVFIGMTSMSSSFSSMSSM